MGTPLDYRTADQQPARKPGDFRRRGVDGPPLVASLTKTRQPTGLKADLADQCAKRGIEVPDKATVATLKDLLGPEPADETYGRPSGFGSALDNPHALIKWKERQVALGIAMRPELLDRLTNVDAEEERNVLDGIVAQAHEAAGSSLAADRGTHIHLLTERHDRGESYDDLIAGGEALGIPEPLQRQAVAKWAQFRAAMQLTALHVEVAIVHDGWRLAGTADRIDVSAVDIEMPTGMIPAGTPFVGDVKTSQYRTSNDQPMYWTKYGPQVAAYAHGVPYDVAAEQRQQWDKPISEDWALIYNYDLARSLDGEVVDWLAIPVNLAVARTGARIAVEAAEFAKRDDMFAAPLKIAPASPFAGDAPDTATHGNAAATVERATPAALPAAGVADIDPALQLANSVADWSHHLKGLLAVEWPSGVPTPKAVREGKATWTPDDLVRAQAAINEIVGPFDDVAEVPPPAVKPEPPQRPARIDDGAVLDAEVIDSLLATVKASPVVAIMNGWLDEAREAEMSWQPRNGHRERHVEITRAAYHLASIIHADHDDGETPEERVRHILAAALDTEQAQHAASPIGVVLAHLTIDEARYVVGVAQVCSDDRTPTSSDISDGEAA